MDLIMGSFADRYVPKFSDIELDQYEDLLQENDPDLYNWISGRESVPDTVNNPLIERLVGFQVK